MRIFLIGTSLATKLFTQYFSQNKDYIVFCTHNECENEFIDIAPDDICELKDFALANDINLTILCDENTISSQIAKEFEEAGLGVFAPQGEGLDVVLSKNRTKRFAYRNKIPTPHFQTYEKVQMAIDTIRKNPLPIAIKPDYHSSISTRLCETFGSAKSAVEEFFATGSKKIITEDFIQGKEFTIWTICDGYNPVMLGNCATYQNSIVKFEADFLDDNLKNEIFNNTIIPFLTALSQNYGEYLGLLGFDFILASDGQYYLLECNTFLRDLEAQMFIEAIDENWTDLFLATLEGTLLKDFAKIKTKDKYYFAHQTWENGEVLTTTVQGRTKNEAKKMLFEECDCAKEFELALKTWGQ